METMEKPVELQPIADDPRNDTEPLETPQTDAEWRREMDELLAKAQAEQAAMAYTLPMLLGQPQPYAAIPGLFFKRPKLGHKMDVSRRFEVAQRKFEEDHDNDAANNEFLSILLPYTYTLNKDGELIPATKEVLLFEVFDDAEEVIEFFTMLLSAKRGEEKDGPNA